MAKKLDTYELETIVIALEEHYYKTKAELTNEDGSIRFEHILESIDELGKEFQARAEKAHKGWGLTVRTRWDNTTL